MSLDNTNCGSNANDNNNINSGINFSNNNFNNNHDLLLHEACATGDALKLEELGNSIRRGKIEVNAADEDWGDRTALHWAACKGHTKCVKLLLEYGADPAARMVGGWSPAHCAAETGRLNVLKALIDNEAPVSLPDDTGDTPKRVAEIYGHWACVEVLKSAEESKLQKGLRLKDKFRTHTRKISKVLRDRASEDLENNRDKSQGTS